MMFQAAIFDMDGTLLESMGVWKDITAQFLARRSIDLTDEDVRKFRDMTLEESLPLIIKTHNLPDSIEEVFAEFNTLAAEAYRHTIPMKPGAKEYLQKLHASGIKIAIATSGYDTLCRAALTRLGVIDCISAIALSSEVGVNKSNPDVYLLAAERLGTAPQDCMVFEDILIGIQGAKKAGMQTTAVADFSNAEEWAQLKATADRAIEHWAELL